MKLWTKFKHLLGRRARVARLEEEMRHHIEQLTEENVRRGLDRVEALRQAHLAFGNVLATREESEDALGWPVLEAWVHDARIAVRSLFQRPAFALALILVLSLGVGVTAAVFSVVRGVLFEPLPVPRPEELRLVREAGGDPFLLSAPTIRRLENDAVVRGRVAGYSDPSRVAWRRGESPAEPCLVQFVNGGFFPALGVAAWRGRALGPADDTTAAQRAVAVVSHAFWKSRLGAEEAAIGRTMRLNDQEVTIVGVAPAGFTGVSLGRSPDLWMPLGLHAPLRCSPSAWTISDGPIRTEDWLRVDNVNWLTALIRAPESPAAAGLAGAVEAAWRPQLEAALAIITDPDTRQDFSGRVPRVVAGPQGYSNTRDEFRRVGLTLMLLVGAVVLVMGTNAATLLLLRTLGRGRELGVRLALGAGRWRLAHGALMEGMLISGAGTLGGTLLGLWFTPLLVAWLVPTAEHDIPGFDWTMLGMLSALAVFLGLAMGAAPAWLSARLSPQSILQQRTLGVGGTLRLGRGLIVAQLGLSVMLTAIAGSLALDLHRVLTANPGYARESVVQTFFDLGASGIPAERQTAVLERLRMAAQQMPRVRGVGFAASGVLSGSRSASGMYFRGEGVKQPRNNIQHESIDEGYLAAMGLALVRGRAFTAHDAPGRPNVALVSERLAREVFGTADPIGRRFGFDEKPGAEDWEVVGIVADARVNSLRDEPPAMFYTPIPQWRARPACLVVRVDGVAAAAKDTLRKAVSTAEPGLMFTRWATLGERTQTWASNDLATVRLTAGFGLIATLLAVIGVLGALGYLVASRSREIAVRLAIGAEPTRVSRDIVRDALALGLTGSAAGIGLAALLPHVLGSWMMAGLTADWRAIAAAALTGLLAAFAGGLMPARRAAKVDPLVLLRAE